jgi:hypothetical protein
MEIDENAMRSQVWARINNASLRKVAIELGISAAYLSDIMAEKRAVSSRVAEKLGYQRVISRTIVFRPIEEKPNGNSGVDVANAGRPAKRSRNRSAVPVLPNPKGDEKHVHSLQPLRNQLGNGRGHHERPETQPETHADHQTFNAGDKGRWCSTCKAYF